MSYRLFPFRVDSGKPTIFDRPYRDPSNWKREQTKKQKEAERLAVASTQYRLHQAINKRGAAQKKK